MDPEESELKPAPRESQGTANNSPNAAPESRHEGRSAQSQDAGTNLTVTDRSRGKQGSRRNTKKRSTRAKKAPQEDANGTNKAPPKFNVIQEWHIVLSDLLARDSRTTEATKMARAIKEGYKKRFWRENQDVWVPDAIRELKGSVQNKWKENKELADVGLVLVKCNGNEKTKRRIRPGTFDTYGYEDDDEPTFGIGKEDEALAFFFKSKDAPKLEDEIKKHMKKLERLRESDKKPPLEEMNDFQTTLQFFQNKLERAKNDCVLAKKLLKSLHPIKALNSQWKALEQQSTLKVAPAAAAAPAAATPAFHQPHGADIPMNHAVPFNVPFNAHGMSMDSTRARDATRQFTPLVYDPHRQENVTQPLHRGPAIPLPEVPWTLPHSHPSHNVTANQQLPPDELFERAGMVGDVGGEEDMRGSMQTGRPIGFQNQATPRNNKRRKTDTGLDHTERTDESYTMDDTSIDDLDLPMEAGGDAHYRPEERWRSLEDAAESVPNQSAVDILHSPIATSPIHFEDLESQPVTPEPSPETTRRMHVPRFFKKVTVFGMPLYDAENNRARTSVPTERDGGGLRVLFGRVRNRVGRVFLRWRRD